MKAQSVLVPVPVWLNTKVSLLRGTLAKLPTEPFHYVGFITDHPGDFPLPLEANPLLFGRLSLSTGEVNYCAFSVPPLSRVRGRVCVYFIRVYESL